jgi:hypothetical protein
MSSLFVPHEPCVILVEYNMCSLLLFPQQMKIMKMIIVMSTSLGVNQSTTSLC